MVAMGTVVDDILVQQLGQFGRGQLILLAVSGLGWANLAMQVFLTTFTAADPLSPGSWQCRSTFTQCTDAKGVCALPPGELIWTRPEHSVVAQFGLICGQSWKVCVQLCALA